MWQKITIGNALVECNPDATREAYATVPGGISSCECAYCENYRLVRERIYPSDFLELLQRLGIDYRKELELTHLSEDEAGGGLAWGHSCFGHYAFVGRVLEPESTAHDLSRFAYEVSSGDQVHPVTRATFGNSPEFIDLNFRVPRVPKAPEDRS